MCFGNWARFAADRRGNVAMMFGLLMIPLVFATGAAIDYGVAARTKDKLNAAADAAVLAAVTPKMMSQSSSQAQTAATNVFAAHVSNIRGLSFDPNALSVVVNDDGLKRTVQVSYRAAVSNAFARLYRQPTTTIGVSTTSSASVAPNIDFYMLLDTSPSMAIAATTDGINTMVANTKNQGGCAFGCHQIAPDSNNPGGIDNYQLARNLKVALRIDNVEAAVENLTTTAQNAMSSNNATYRMAIYTFDINFRQVKQLHADMNSVKTAAKDITMLQVYSNNYITKGNNNSDTDTDYDTAMKGINDKMPDPGNGTALKTDSPQEILFLVTDGVEDEVVTTCAAGVSCVSLGGGKLRQQSMMSNDWCTTIKNRGIRIAVLYTTYFPLPTNSWYNSYIAPFQSKIGPNMQSCASPGLFFEVNTDQDISAAMSALFQQAVATAHLTK